MMSKCSRCHGTGTIVDYEVGSGGPIHEYPCTHCKKGRATGRGKQDNPENCLCMIEPGGPSPCELCRWKGKIRAHIRTLRKRGHETEAIDLERILDGEA